MTTSPKFRKCLEQTLVFEGGKDDDPRDPGGRTAFGIIQTEYTKWRKKNGLSNRDVWKITVDEKETIYYENYWEPLRCEELPVGTDFVMFDYGVNSGLGRAIKHAQAVLDLSVDGKYGPKTFEALKNADPVKFINDLDNKRLSFLQNLSTWSVFGKGWKNRVSIGRAFAIQLAKGLK